MIQAKAEERLLEDVVDDNLLDLSLEKGPDFWELEELSKTNSQGDGPESDLRHFEIFEYNDDHDMVSPRTIPKFRTVV